MPHFCFEIKHFLQMDVSYIDSSRGVRYGAGSQYIYHRRTGYTVRMRCKRNLWGYLFYNDVALI